MKRLLLLLTLAGCSQAPKPQPRPASRPDFVNGVLVNPEAKASAREQTVEDLNRHRGDR